MIKPLWLAPLGRMFSSIKITECSKCNIIHIEVHRFYITIQQCFDKFIIIGRCRCKPAFEHIRKHAHSLQICDGKRIPRLQRQCPVGPQFFLFQIICNRPRIVNITMRAKAKSVIPLLYQIFLFRHSKLI